MPSTMSLLKGAAFITGAASGIGQSTAYAFARYGISRLALCDIHPGNLKESINQLKERYPDLEILPIEMDTSEENSVTAAIASTVSAFGRLDVAVNNADIAGTPLPTHENSLEDWQRVMSVNLNGVWLCQRAQIQQFLKQEPLSPAPRGSRGVIVNVASMLGLVASHPSTPAASYTASKHGVVGLTRTDAMAYASQGIRINAVCPGYIATPILKSASEAGFMAELVQQVPQQRLGEPEEVAESIVYLASPSRAS
ncbi:Short-chain dehydrogenase srdC [Fulvia fulva]|nr:Short-chain dehydrogenase srdC [Fulvia fulva]KAK4620349.1 Short-chain dehydrogenase srdC [Fulvia fulva]WPV17744.1 Short-chain dehydrogenase srdC [Fulvia fulva]WPV32487.1 Short-chain dehydrogenase srdC [Fulvia fulva]